MRVANKLTKQGCGDHVGLFIPFPPHIVRQFPGGVDGNGGPPHVTFLYAGKVPPPEQVPLARAFRKVVPRHVRGPVRARLGQLDFFQQPSERQRVVHLQVRFSYDLARARDLILDDLHREGFYLDNRFPVFRPHVTLQYRPGLGPEPRYRGPLPEGEWVFDSVEVWDLPRVISCPFGRRRVATKSKSEKEDEEAERLVRKSPKKKPKRKDRRRGRIKVDDPDMVADVKNDPDMSLNYKKVARKSQS